MKATQSRRRVWILIASAVVLFALYSAVGERGLIRFTQMASQRDSLKEKVQSLERNNAELADQVSRLRDDPATIETLARTELGMVREGETVYIFSGQPEVDDK